ncbi:MAG: RNA polymerase sigma factor [Coriobacteriia bacterium]|nr:RNA polymerase sigma factor [Coriobacteriia bacterium]
MDDARFERAWNAHGSAVLRYCTYATGSQHDGEDVTAETFIRYLAKGDGVAPERTEAWLIRVAINLCASRYRATRRLGALESRLANHAQAPVREAAPSDSWEYVRHLKDKERQTLYLHLAEDRTFADIARLTGRSESAVKMTFYRAIEHLRRAMQRDGAEPHADFVGGTDNA